MTKYYYVVYVHSQGTGITSVKITDSEFNPYKFRKEYLKRVAKPDLIVTNWIEISEEIYNSIKEYKISDSKV